MTTIFPLWKRQWNRAKRDRKVCTVMLSPSPKVDPYYGENSGNVE